MRLDKVRLLFQKRLDALFLSRRRRLEQVKLDTRGEKGGHHFLLPVIEREQNGGDAFRTLRAGQRTVGFEKLLDLCYITLTNSRQEFLFMAHGFLLLLCMESRGGERDQRQARNNCRRQSALASCLHRSSTIR